MRADIRPRDARDRMIVALDVGSVEEAAKLVASLGDAVSFYKIGMQLVFAGGLQLVTALTKQGKRIFLDMKLLDIDNTVAGAVSSIARLGVTFTTIHAYPKAMRAAVAANPKDGTGLLAVTVLTSMDDADAHAAGYASSAADLVAARAADAREAGMDGIVCAPQEIASVRAIVGTGMAIVTPGIRPAGSAADDQKRVMTPAEAIAAGADYLVVGRPITAAAESAGGGTRDHRGNRKSALRGDDMAKAYWIARVDVSDADTYADYVKANAEPFARFGAKFLVRGGRHEAPEGTARTRNVILEFPSYEAALACYRDPAYEKAMAIRKNASEGDLVIIEGYDGAQPGD